MLFTEMPAGTDTGPTPVAPKIAPSPAGLLQAAPVQFMLVVSQVEFVVPLSQVLSAAAAEPVKIRAAATANRRHRRIANSFAPRGARRHWAGPGQPLSVITAAA